MANKRYQKFSGKKGAPTGQSGMRHDGVSPIKTKSWPGIPGKTQPKTRNFGMKKMCQGLADKGV